MSIMSKLAMYVGEMKVGKIYSGLGGMVEVQKNKTGEIFAYNFNDFCYMGIPAKSIKKINPRMDSLVYYLRDVG